MSDSAMFKDQVAIVTGAGQGIGYEMCRQLVQEGAVVLRTILILRLQRGQLQLLTLRARFVLLWAVMQLSCLSFSRWCKQQ